MIYIDVAEVQQRFGSPNASRPYWSTIVGLTFHLGFLLRASRRSARSAGVRNVGAAGYRITLSSCLRCAGRGRFRERASLHLPLRRIVVVFCREVSTAGFGDLGGGNWARSLLRRNARTRNPRACRLADARCGAPPRTHLHPRCATRTRSDVGASRLFRPAGHPLGAASDRGGVVSGPHVPTGVWFPSGTLLDLTPSSS